MTEDDEGDWWTNIDAEIVVEDEGDPPPEGRTLEVTVPWSAEEPDGRAAVEPPTAGPEPESVPRGTLAMPADADFLQTLEVRAKNGASTPRNETSYVLLGETHTTPDRLVALDSAEFYNETTPERVGYRMGEIAEHVADSYGREPGLIARFHTHPQNEEGLDRPVARPSDLDRQGAERTRRAFERTFDTDGFEFFQGIHAFIEATVDPEDRRRPDVSGGTLLWYGDQYRHEIAVFDPAFRRQRDITLV